MTPFQQMLMGVGGATKIYVDEVFSTQTYIGNDSNRSITNGLDLSTEGGLVWSKARTGSSAMLHLLYDTERGVTKDISSQSTDAEGTSSTIFTAFNTNGYSVGTSAYTNENNSKFASWSFRKSAGFFDVIKYTGTGSPQNISHSLGGVPGFILVKNLSSSIDWAVWHRASAELDTTNTLKLNTSGANATNNTYFDDGTTPPTSTYFKVHTSNRVNASGSEYIAYVFAGGAATDATAKSLDFDGGAGDYLSLAASSDFNWTNLANDPFTIEFWIRPDGWDTNDTLVRQDNGGYWIHKEGSNFKFSIYDFSGTNYDIVTTTQIPERSQWTHVAVVKQAINNGGTNPYKLYFNGTEVGSGSINYTHSAMTTFKIGSGGSGGINGKMSNFRFTKAEVYTSSFKPPTEPLANITGTKLLCCNDSSTTGSTVTPGTITANGTITASTHSPFDDSEGFKFGSGGEGIIKCGGYKGNGSSTGPVVDLGWEPQWVMVKNQDSTGSWYMFDTMRGIITGQNDAKLQANESNLEEDDADWLELTPTGFQLVSTNSNVNADHYNYLYVAIRRPDGWVSKPASAGTDVFAMDLGNASSTIPTFDSGFPVDYAIVRQFASTDNWGNYSRLTGDSYLRLNTTDSQGTYSGGKWDSNLGWAATNYWDSNRLSWMFKRGPGFDVVAYEGNSQNSRIIRHSLGAAPDMMWIKNRDDTTDWIVGHIGLDGGNEPWTHYLKLNTNDSEGDYDYFMDKAPTAYSFEVTTGAVNDTNKSYLALLFKSITGISKAGSYTGTGMEETLSVTTGFQPRFLIIKGTASWYLFDTVRGWAAGNDEFMKVDTTSAQNGSYDWGAPTATGFDMSSYGNQIGQDYIYYAHA